MKLIKKGFIPASYCDADLKMSVIGAFQMVEDLITDMMGELDIDGITCKRKYDAMWVIARNRIEILRDLCWKEEYTAACYISDIGKVCMTEDTILKNADGQVAMASRLELCAVDLKKMKLRKTNTVGLSGSIMSEEPEIDIRFERGRFEPVQLLDEVTIRSSDIDYGHHTNNISYVRYLMNQWSVEELSACPVRTIEVQYTGQTHEGDRLKIWKCRSDENELGKERFSILHDEKSVMNMCVKREGSCLKES